MQTFLIAQSTWYFVAREPEAGMPPRIAIKSPFRVGRREGFDLCLTCRNVSGLHAELVEESGKLWVDDLNSTNGTFVNGEQIRTKTELNEGDEVQFGTSVFSVVNIGKNKSTATRVFDGGMIAPEPESTEDRFKRLLKDGVVPFFQPIYNISGAESQKIGFEVLGRSRLFGLKTPDQMFAAATDLEMESELSRVLRLRGVEAADSELPSDLTLFVNTHQAEMECSEIHESLKEIRKKFPSRTIMLELPEQVLYAPESYAEMCRGLKDLDVQLVMHDFGAGQIRLAELSELAPSVVKFDCALIHGIDKANEKRQRLVSAMVKMVTELGIKPMAEYIETEGEHETLRELGFELAQGFFYGHPSSVESLEESKSSTEADSNSNSEPDTTSRKKANQNSDNRPLQKLKSFMSAQDQIADIQIDTSDASDDSDQEEVIAESLESEPADSDDLKKAIRDFLELTKAEEATPIDREFKEAHWLLEQDDECFTIQLMFAATTDEAKNFLARMEQDGEYAIYRKMGSTIAWSVVLHGIYDSREQAKEATVAFEGTGHSSWVRSMASVKNEIRSLIGCEE